MSLLKARRGFLSIAVVAVLLLLLVPTALAWPFGDVPVGHWAYNSIQRIAYLNITSGCGDGNYCPDDFVSRAQMAGFLKNMTEAHTDEGLAYIFSVDNQNDGTNNSGDGIVAASWDENGLEGWSYGGSAADHGVYGRTNSTGSGDAGVYGTSLDNAAGVYGHNSNSDTATTASYGVRAYSAQGHGVYSDGGPEVGDYGGYFVGHAGVRAAAETGGRGVYATADNNNAGRFESSSGNSVWAGSVSAYGVYAQSEGSYAIYANTYVSGGYGLYTGDKIYTAGGCVGCTSMLIAQNGGDAALEPGDVVAVVGIAKGPSEFYARPVLLVRQADSTSSQGVVGVVEGRYVVKQVEREEVEIKTRYVEVPDPEGEGEPDVVPVEEQTVKKVKEEDAHTTTKPAAPGELLTVIYRGIAQVKVSAASEGIQVGDLLVAAGASGRATKAVATEGGALPSGTIIGKALEPLGKGQQLIWVLVDLQ